MGAISEVEWSDFISNHPQGNVFQTPEMYRVYQATKNYEPLMTICKQDDRLVGIILAVCISQTRGPLGFFTSRIIIWGGPLVVDNDPLITSFILESFNQAYEGMAVYGEFRNLYVPFQSWKKIFGQNGFSYLPHLNITIDLSVSEGVLWRKVSPSRRRNIKKP